jgi:hypothetical protein
MQENGIDMQWYYRKKKKTFLPSVSNLISTIGKIAP